MPSFKGGISAMQKWLSSNIKYPMVAKENNIQGRVIVSVVIEKDGRVTNPKVIRSVDPSLDREAIRVINAMPNWYSGRQNGHHVRVKYNIIVPFRQ